MASYRLTPYGVKVTLDDAEVKILCASFSAGSQATALISAALVGFGITAPGSVVAAITSALFGITSTGLSGCNYRGKGIFLYVLWVGVPWCKTR